jgi:Xaa-Pro aminopeptidase
MPNNSVAVFFLVRNRTNDVDYVYHQDPDFFYLTGYKEPNSVLVFSRMNKQINLGKSIMKFLYSRKKYSSRNGWGV